MKRLILIPLFVCLACSGSFASDIESRVKAMEDILKKQQQMIDAQQKVIEQLKGELEATAKKQETLTVAEKPASPGTGPKPSGASALFGGSFMTNPYISFILDTNFYSSSINERELANRGIPGYSNLGFEQKKGFNLTAGELFLFAPVDPYFNLYATIPFTENGASIEEAFFLTTDLPQGFQVKGGKFKSNFSRLNAQHPHTWDFADLPLAYRAFLGGEGLIEKGAQLTYLPGLPFYTILGMEVLQGENEVIFNKNATGGPHGFTGFVKQSIDVGDYSTLLFGPYAMGGQTRTTTVANGAFFRGNSQLYGFEAVYKWKPSKYKSLIIQGEYMVRKQDGTLSNALGAASGLTRAQDGAYVQALYQVDRWRFGARYDRLSIFNSEYDLGGVDRQFGPAPWRATGAVELNLSEFSRLRLQYNYDRSGGDGKTNNEVYLQLILGIGAHSAHAF
ncbi:MAG TPA: hypothetical protein VGJ94_11645 [Syntrophorhabdaceae bacterium]